MFIRKEEKERSERKKTREEITRAAIIYGLV